jgi:hypothetical protein
MVCDEAFPWILLLAAFNGTSACPEESVTPRTFDLVAGIRKAACYGRENDDVITYITKLSSCSDRITFIPYRNL